MFKGIIVALVTPMHANGDVDYSQLESLIDFHVREGTKALVIAGTTGESATLSPDARGCTGASLLSTEGHRCKENIKRIRVLVMFFN